MILPRKPSNLPLVVVFLVITFILGNIHLELPDEGGNPDENNQKFFLDHKQSRFSGVRVNQESKKSFELFVPTLEDTELNSDKVTGIAVDSQNNILVVGNLEDDTPIWDKGSKWDAFVSKFTNTGKLAWSRTLTGKDFEVTNDVAIDNNDNVIILGTTDSEDFNTTADAHDPSYNGGVLFDLFAGDRDLTIVGDMFLRKLTSTGTLQWSTFLGGSVFEKGLSLAMDHQDNIIVIGMTVSLDFPTTPDAYDRTHHGSGPEAYDLTISKFNSTGAILWSTYFGGIEQEDEHAEIPNLGKKNVVIDSDDNIILTSTTASPDFPAPNGIDTTLNGSTDAIIAKFNSTGALLWSSFWGGSSTERGTGVITDSQNNIFLVGTTSSPDFNTTLDAYNDTLGGVEDGFITKFNSTGALVWSSYLGGDQADQILSAAQNKQNQLIVTGFTEAPSFPTTPDAYSDMFGGEQDAFIAILDSAGNLNWSTLLGGVGDDKGFKVVTGHNNDLLVAGYTNSVDFPVTENVYNYSFGGLTDGFLSKFNASKALLWSTRAPVVTEADADPDGDELTNNEEFFYPSAFGYLNPLNNDTDGDGMPDGWEVDHELNPLYASDAENDEDKDELTNLDEFLHGLNPRSNDTDSDMMLDAWEVLMGLNGTNPADAADDPDNDSLTNLEEFTLRLNATNADTDYDTMPDGWEVEFTLNASLDDAGEDLDTDGLTNQEEYERQLNPNDRDTDGDGMPDAWEVDHRLNPRRNDANEDADGDLLTNRLEYSLGFDPQDPRETLLGLAIVVVLVSLSGGFLFLSKWHQRTALALGFANYGELKQARNAGFSSAQEQADIKKLGFLTMESHQLATAAGFTTAAALIAAWHQAPIVFEDKIPNEEIQGVIQLIEQTTSPMQLARIEQELESLLTRITQVQQQLKQNLALQQTIGNLSREKNIFPLATLNEPHLLAQQQKTEATLLLFEQYQEAIQNAITQRQEWFVPWPQLLNLIQVTEDRMPVKLHRIAEIVGCDEQQAEAIILALLHEDDSIGEYDQTTKVYTKGQELDKLVASYLKKAQQVVAEIGKDISD